MNNDNNVIPLAPASRAKRWRKFWSVLHERFKMPQYSTYYFLSMVAVWGVVNGLVGWYDRKETQEAIDNCFKGCSPPHGQVMSFKLKEKFCVCAKGVDEHGR